jgi:hypothetical protein
MILSSSGLAEEILCAAMLSSSSFVFGYFIPFSTLSTSAADGKQMAGVLFRYVVAAWISAQSLYHKKGIEIVLVLTML